MSSQFPDSSSIGASSSSFGRSQRNIDSEPNDENRLKSRYGEHALRLARYALISQSAGRPLRRKDLMQILKPANSDLSRHAFARYLRDAKAFLKDRLGMTLVELGTVRLNGTSNSPSRDEYMLITLSHKFRREFRKVVPKTQLREWGIMCFALILIVLRSDGLKHSDLFKAFVDSKLYMRSTLEADNDMNEAAEFLQRSMQKLVAQRVFESVRSTKRGNSSGGTSDSGGANATNEPEEIYFIGPSAKYLIKSSDLYLIMLKLHYPREDLNSEEFRKKHSVALRSLKQKFESTNLGSVE